ARRRLPGGAGRRRNREPRARLLRPAGQGGALRALLDLLPGRRGGSGGALAERRRVRRVACYAVLIVWLIVVLGPLYWLLLTSLKLPVTVGRGPSYLPWVDFQPVLTN